jgi:hypothetical protein
MLTGDVGAHHQLIETTMFVATCDRHGNRQSTMKKIRNEKTIGN